MVKEQTFKLALTNDHMQFSAENASGNKITIDTYGGGDKPGGTGPSPMELLAMGLGGCSAMDVISMLRKSKQPVESFDIEVRTKKPADAHPSPYSHMHLHFIVNGGDIKSKRVARAVELSVTKYCSASAMLKHDAQITTSFEINGEQFEETATANG